KASRVRLFWLTQPAPASTANTARLLDATRHRLLAHRIQAFAQRMDAGGQRAGIDRADDEVGARPALAPERITADRAAFVRLFGYAQQIGHFAFLHPAPDSLAQHRRAAFESTGQRVEHAGGDFGHAGHDDQVAAADA